MQAVAALLMFSIVSNNVLNLHAECTLNMLDWTRRARYMKINFNRQGKERIENFGIS